MITISKDAPVWEILDAGAFEQSLLLSAYNQGVDTIVAVAFVAHVSYLHKKLNIPDDEAVVMFPASAVVRQRFGPREQALQGIEAGVIYIRHRLPVPVDPHVAFEFALRPSLLICRRRQ